MTRNQKILAVGGVLLGVGGGVYMFQRYQQGRDESRILEDEQQNNPRTPQGPEGEELPPAPPDVPGGGQDVVRITPQRGRLPIESESKCGGAGFWPRVRTEREVKRTDLACVGRETSFSKSARRNHPLNPITISSDVYKGRYYVVSAPGTATVFSPIGIASTTTGPRWPNNRFRVGDVLGYDAQGRPSVGGFMFQGDWLPVIGFQAEDCPRVGNAQNWVPILGESMGYVGGPGYNQEGKFVGGSGGWWIPASATEPWLQPKRVTL